MPLCMHATNAAITASDTAQYMVQYERQLAFAVRLEGTLSVTRMAHA